MGPYRHHNLPRKLVEPLSAVLTYHVVVADYGPDVFTRCRWVYGDVHPAFSFHGSLGRSWGLSTRGSP